MDEVPSKSRIGKVNIAAVRRSFLLNLHVRIMKHQMNNNTQTICVYLVKSDREVNLELVYILYGTGNCICNASKSIKLPEISMACSVAFQHSGSQKSCNLP